jgi:hypothetical protein
MFTMRPEPLFFSGWKHALLITNVPRKSMFITKRGAKMRRRKLEMGRRGYQF